MYNPNSTTTVTTDRLLGDDYLKVDAVYNGLTDITAVATNLNIISSVNDNMEGLQSIYPHIDTIVGMEPYFLSIEVLGDNIDSVNTVALHVDSVNTVTTNIQDVTTVSANIPSVTKVAENIDDITHLAVENLYFTPSNEIAIEFQDGNFIKSEPLQFNSEDKSTIVAALNKIPVTQTVGIAPIAGTDRFGISYFGKTDIEGFKDENGVVDLETHPLTVEDNLGMYLFYHENTLSQFLTLTHTKDSMVVQPEDWQVTDTVIQGSIPKGAIVTSVMYEDITKPSDLSPYYKLTVGYAHNGINMVVKYRSVNPLTTAVDLRSYVEQVGQASETNAKNASVPRTGGDVVADNPELNVFTKEHNSGVATFRLGNMGINYGHMYFTYDAKSDTTTWGTYNALETREMPILSTKFDGDTVNFTKSIFQNGVDVLDKNQVNALISEMESSIDKKVADAITATKRTLTPVGTIIARYSWDVPDSTWRRCTGGTVTESECPDYFREIGPNIPNMTSHNGLFLRMASNNHYLGNVKEHAIQNIIGTVGMYYGDSDKEPSGINGAFQVGFRTKIDQSYLSPEVTVTSTQTKQTGWYYPVDFRASRQVNTDEYETYPSHLNVCYFIKVKY